MMYGYLVNSDNNNFITILNETGNSASAETNWQTSSGYTRTGITNLCLFPVHMIFQEALF